MMTNGGCNKADTTEDPRQAAVADNGAVEAQAEADALPKLSQWIEGDWAFASAEGDFGVIFEVFSTIAEGGKPTADQLEKLPAQERQKIEKTIEKLKNGDTTIAETAKSTLEHFKSTRLVINSSQVILTMGSRTKEKSYRIVSESDREIVLQREGDENTDKFTYIDNDHLQYEIPMGNTPATLRLVRKS